MPFRAGALNHPRAANGFRFFLVQLWGPAHTNIYLGLICTSKQSNRISLVQPIPADMRLLFAKGIPYCLLPNLDSVNHCTSKYLFISILISLLVLWLTESRYGKTKFGFPIEIRSLMSAGIGCNCTSPPPPNPRFEQGGFLGSTP